MPWDMELMINPREVNCDWSCLNLGDVGAHFDDVPDLPLRIAHRGRIHQDIDLFPFRGRHHLLRLVDLAVVKGLFHDAGNTRLRAGACKSGGIYLPATPRNPPEAAGSHRRS